MSQLLDEAAKLDAQRKADLAASDEAMEADLQRVREFALRDQRRIALLHEQELAMFRAFGGMA
jgi:hypothetical protein